MIIVLSLILFLLLLIIGKKRGVKTFISFYISLFIILFYIILMSMGFNPIILAIITCIVASYFILFFLNGNNIKTKAAFISIIFVFSFIFLLSYFIINKTHIGGFSQESIETIGGFSYDINYNMNKVIIGVFLVGIIGTITDTSMSITSSLYEVFLNNPNLSSKELFKSGMNIGKDILATTINTLFFALVINFIGFFLWHYNMKISFLINYKVFASDVINLFICFIASTLIIPFSAYIASIMYKKN